METGKKLIQTLRGFTRKMSQDHTSAYAAQAAYFIILSFIPFMLLLMTSVKYTSLTREEVIWVIMQVCPESFFEFIASIVYEVYAKSLAVVPLSAVMALWSAGKGIQALTNGFNCIYQVKETRNFILTRIRAVLYTLAFVISIVLTLILQVFGNSLQRELSKRFPFLSVLVTRIISMRIVITLSMLFLADGKDAFGEKGEDKVFLMLVNPTSKEERAAFDLRTKREGVPEKVYHALIRHISDPVVHEILAPFDYKILELK